MKNRIREIRINKGMKLTELAELSNLSRGYISHLESGTKDNPSYNTMVKISRALKETVSKVFETDKIM